MKIWQYVVALIGVSPDLMKFCWTKHSHSYLQNLWRNYRAHASAILFSQTLSKIMTSSTDLQEAVNALKRFVQMFQKWVPRDNIRLADWLDQWYPSNRSCWWYSIVYWSQAELQVSEVKFLSKHLTRSHPCRFTDRIIVILSYRDKFSICGVEERKLCRNSNDK